jgi:hypothetical protein
VADADRWQSVFVDAAGGHGLPGQAEGRAGSDVIAWLAARSGFGFTSVTSQQRRSRYLASRSTRPRLALAGLVPAHHQA